MEPEERSPRTKTSSKPSVNLRKEFSCKEPLGEGIFKKPSIKTDYIPGSKSARNWMVTRYDESEGSKGANDRLNEELQEKRKNFLEVLRALLFVVSIYLWFQYRLEVLRKKGIIGEGLGPAGKAMEN